jgi:glycosyltransferase involved in cell wall biosynthesis
MKKVVIVQRIVPHYRVPFFDLLVDKLKAQGITLKVVYGQESLGTVPKSVKVEREWAIFVDNSYGRFIGLDFVWQPVLSHVRGANLVVVEQANRLLVNYLFILKRFFTNFNLAFWGHGKNLQSQNRTGFLETWKRLISVNVDWWFAYTEKSARMVHALGFDAGKITNVENSIDTSALQQAKAGIADVELLDLKLALGITTNNIGIYCGGMYKEKNIEFLISACKKIRGEIKDFQIIFIGDGPDAVLVNNFAVENDWVHYVGEITGNERVPYFMISKVFLMPGLVGLAVLDAFALNVPMVTTDIPIHSPEYEYLVSGTNGIVTAPKVESFSGGVIELLNDENRLLEIVENCKISSEKYSVDNMAINFCAGIVKSLSKA